MSGKTERSHLGGEKMKNYLINGRVAREEIAADICDGTLSKSELQTLLNNSDVRDAFIGTQYDKKKDRQGWNKQYLEELPNVAVAEAFNEDYLRYISDVAEYVRTKENNKSIPAWVWIVAIVLIVGGVMVYSVIKSRN